MIASLIPISLLNRRSNQAQVTCRASLGKPIVPIVFFQETTIHFFMYGGRHLISMEEDPKLVCRKTIIHINKGKAYGRQGKAPTGRG